MEGVHTHDPEVYQDLIKYYNRAVLPDLHPNVENRDDQDDHAGAPPGACGGLSTQDQVFLERLQAAH